MRGRKKYAGEKYEAGAPLNELWSKSWFGEFEHSPPISYVAEIVRNLRKPGGVARRLSLFRKPGEAERLLLKYIGDYVLKTGRWEEFGKIHKMFLAAESWSKSEFPAADIVRSSLLTANDLLFALAHHNKRKEVKKGDLLKLWRRTAGTITEDIEDADAFKKMRQLGLPRKPAPGPLWDHILKISKPLTGK